MKKSLFSKMMATYTLIIAISFVITATFLSFWFQNYYFDQRKKQLMSESQIIAPVALQYLNGNISRDRMSYTLDSISKYLNVDILLTDSYGYLYAVSNDKYNKYMGNGKQFLTKELDELRAGNAIETQERYGDIFKVPVRTYEIPIMQSRSGTYSGAIVMITSISGIKEPLKVVYEIIWSSALFAIGVSCFVIYYFSQRIIVRPLEQINYVSKKISKGEVDKRVQIDSQDEIGELAESFNYMADSLEKVENTRREFISNVSHEIRSPITSIKGFIGGILDGVIPKEKESYYLSLAYEEIGRLTRLVNDLLDLSAIEDGHLRLNKEKIDINEFIRIAIIKFETKIKDKNIKVDVVFKEDNLYVMADRDRLNQVVINLIDNGVKYVNESGNVNIWTKARGDKVIVGIYNNGPSIDEEEMKHIWDRFYKSDKARTSKISTGLGLPIVRSILTQHGEDIYVNNKREGGVEFTFSLKRI